ncbi:MAG: 1-acyl-sn-glycerol-3-phosphate acyltransferase [Bacteroidales bacterium]|nr:1-acyl-sn-glycerol-3-phosphate acyltransferase [Bacteroidales bacterium]
MKTKLADFNFFYSLFLPVVLYGVRCHYRRFMVKGRENIPWGEPFIIAPCHQNALMDALVVLQVMNRKTVFLARADIFQNPVARFFLTWLRISPVYRIRDGRESLSRNEDIFNTSREVIEKNVPLCLMAEGRHNDRHQLLPLVKGMFRIAGATQVELGDRPLYILPVGLDYDHYECLYHNVCANIGKPIDVRQFVDEYETNEPVALNHMRRVLTASLKGQMHDVVSHDRYDDELAYCHMKTQATLGQLQLKNNPWGRFMARKYISESIASMPEEQRTPLYDQGAAFADECRRRGVPLWFASKGWSVGKGLLALLASLLNIAAIVPIWKYWLVSNVVVYVPTHLIVRRAIEDTQFRSSVNYGIRMLLQFINAVVVFIVFTCVHNVWWGLGMMALCAVSAWVTPRIFMLLRDVWYGLKSHSR